MTFTTTPAGRLEGLRLDGAYAFLGIPYARPPLGSLRFRPPQAFGHWSGTRSAKAYGASCPQDPDEIGIPHMPLAVGDTDENCLYLNVWTPAPDGKPRPVLFWVHGGSFTAGSGSEPFYAGARLAAEQDVVVVTVNYRLGALGGFVYLVRANDDQLAESANVGILDVLLALKWVRDNIAALGGDPGCVTLAGQSAGGKLVAVVMGMAQSRGLFHRAILQSPGSPSLLDAAEARAIADEFLKQLGTNDPGEIVRCSSRALYKAAVPLAQAMTLGPSGPPIGPILDGDVIRTQPLESIAAGSARDIPVLAGYTTHEMELLLRRAALDVAGDDVLRQVAMLLPPTIRGPIIEACSSGSIDALRPSAPAPVPFFFGERMVRMGVVRLLEAQLRHQQQCFAYLFEWQTEVHSGAPHCIELPFLFGTTFVHDVIGLIGTGPEVESVGRALRSRWAAFMRTGNPAAALTDEWPAYTCARRATQILGRTNYLADDPWSVQRLAWDGVELPGGSFSSASHAF
jgi:para-nitrobenzyl esterase